MNMEGVIRMKTDNIIRDRRKELGYTLKEVADYVGVSEASISRWESGHIANMKRDKIAKLAKILELSPAAIVGTEEEDAAPTIATDFYSYPILGEVAAGYEHFAEYEDSFGNIDIPVSWTKGRKREDYFILRVSGDSMYPQYQDGDLVLVLRQTTMNYSGQIGVVVYDDNKATLKKVEYVMGEDWMRLVPINPSYPPIMVTDERLEHCRVLGIAKMVIREVH